jgi:2,3-bisphosphoglycerate-independent phosphoglycerate mutase
MARRDKKTGEPKRDANGQLIPSTSHSLNPVPFLLYDPTGTYKLVPPVAAPESAGSIARIGATLLTLAGLPIPSDYLPSLIERTDR